MKLYRLGGTIGPDYDKSPDQMNAEQVRSYLLYLLEERKLSWSAIHVNRAALRFLYVRVLRQRWFDEEIQPPRRHAQLPNRRKAPGDDPTSGQMRSE